MYSSLQLAAKYISYFLKAGNSKGHGIHSPFVFDFIQDVLNNRKGFHPGPYIEAVRRQLLKDDTVLEIQDFGAGSRISQLKTRKVREIASSALKPKKYAELLFRLVKKYQPASIIELGTSFGITTAYLATANPSVKLVTIEGAPAIHGMAVNLFKQLNLDNIQAVQGRFEDVLPQIAGGIDKVDLVYIDGNHRKDPTINYFRQFLPHVHNETIMVFDDIHWSKEMEEAWAFIKEHQQVRCTIDIFFLGFVFFRSEFSEKQQFTIRF